MTKFKFNDLGLIYLDKDVMNAIFQCVYYVFQVDSNGMIIVDNDQDSYRFTNNVTKKLLKNSRFQHFIRELKWRQEFNYRNRTDDCYPLFDLFEQTIGPMERNSDGTTLYLALGLALKEYYNLREATLLRLLKLVRIKEVVSKNL
jgi:hypothetical protein